MILESKGSEEFLVKIFFFNLYYMYIGVLCVGEALKTTLTLAPGLELPDVSKSFHLFVHETKGITKGVLAQTSGPCKHPAAYLPK